MVSLKPPIPLCPGDALSDCPVDTTLSTILLDGCWSHAGTESHASHVPQCHQAPCLGFIWKGMFLQHLPLSTEGPCRGRTALCSPVQLEAVILQRAPCARCEFLVGMQPSVTTPAGLGSFVCSFNTTVVF